MKVTRFSDAESASHGFTHRFVIGFADLNVFAGLLVGVIKLADYLPGLALRDCGYQLTVPFSGGAETNLALIIGWNGGTTDDDDGALTASELNGAATELVFNLANGAQFATLKTGYVPLDSGEYDAKFTAIAGNLDTLTAGEVVIFLRLTDLAGL